MTVLGKVLVFVNLFFSLAVAFFITQAYAKRTDWARAYKDANAQLTAAAASRDQYIAEAAKMSDDCNKKITAMTGTYQKTLAELDQMKAAVQQLRSEVAAKDEVIKSKGLGDKATISQVTLLTEANGRIEKMLNDANKRLDDQAKVVEDFRQRAVKAEIDNKSLIVRNNELLNVVEEKEKELIKMKATPGGVVTVANASNPPPGDVEGRVKQYDATSGLLTLTIGSDSGVLKGHTLYVYRLEPSGTYVGQVRILEVKPNEAVGKMVTKPRSPVQVNDKVASKIS